MSSTNFTKLSKVLGFLLCYVILVSPVQADWDESMPAKWVQYPDLSPMGIDVNCQEPYVLADDFLCTERGKVTGIHIWGSWLYDILPFQDNPEALRFILSIHKDIPANESPTGYSMPGEVLWFREFVPGEFVARPWADQIVEGWMDPPDQYIFPADWTCWQYNFNINEEEAFFQAGTDSEPIVYWLDVQAMPEDPEARFGWKTSVDHWNDNAVWGMGSEPYPGPWEELYYPHNHELAGQQIDLAFVIQCTDEVQDDRDFGDAPDQPYPTLLGSNGAFHVIISQGPILGGLIDAEPNGQPAVTAMRDDLNNLDDEDGITFMTPLVPGQVATLDAFTVTGGILDAWIDFNVNGNWGDASEQIAISVPLMPGNNPVNFNVPASTPFGATSYARFRISSNGGLPFFGGAADGEVEDYLVVFDEPHEEWDFGDAPDPTYPTLLGSNGARHLYIDGPILGYFVDPEFDGQPDATASGDDTLDGSDDEDGVTFPQMIWGQTCTIQVFTVTGGMLDAWIDYDVNGDWAGAGEQILANYGLAAGNNSITIAIPGTGLATMNTFARFRISSNGGLNFDGPAYDGEVEDYQIRIEEQEIDYKWLQLPDLGTTGIDVNASYLDDGMNYILADDFLCTTTGPITRVWVWGSWLEDRLPFGDDPMGVEFTLSFHTDIPEEQNPDGYSLPGQTIWYRHFPAGAFHVEPWATNIEEGWMDPPQGYIFPADWTCWLYVFDIPIEEAFHQLGNPDEPIVYWLDVDARPLDPDARFGWKTSIDHWNDDATWTFGTEPYNGYWNELHYPPGHELYGQPLDLAFKLEGEAGMVEFDFGDAMDPSYPTLLSSDGARHIVAYNSIILGGAIDSEPDGQPDPAAMGDDMSGIPDEDGVAFIGVISPGGTGTVDVFASHHGFLDAWIDFDGDGGWTQSYDQIFNSYPLVPGLNTLQYAVPTTGTPGHVSFARFRCSTYGGLGFTGLAYNGEVEDYEVWINGDTSAVDDTVPTRFGLYQNMPNPFNPTTTITYDVPADGGHVCLTIYNVSGQRIDTLIEEHRTAGHYQVEWSARGADGRQLPSGVYFYRLQAGDVDMTHKMVLLQ
ncbi:MAG: T9SS type A sorting domain-containing protein [bacterium]|nr:T9SS type A sorting domain-containing protein [bacterium]